MKQNGKLQNAFGDENSSSIQLQSKTNLCRTNTDAIARGTMCQRSQWMLRMGFRDQNLLFSADVSTRSSHNRIVFKFGIYFMSSSAMRIFAYSLTIFIRISCIRNELRPTADMINTFFDVGAFVNLYFLDK